jgi:hypothetical protein
MFTPKVTGQARLPGFNYRAEYNNFRSLAARSMAQESQTMANWTNPKGLITNESAKIRSVDDGQLSRPDLRICQLLFATVDRLISAKGLGGVKTPSQGSW